MPFYVVRRGKKPGIYNTWNECKEQVDRFTGADYRKFDTHAEAENYLSGKLKIKNFAATKHSTTKSKISNKATANLILDTVRQNSKTTSASSNDILHIINSDNDQDDQEQYTVVYSDGCCFGNGSAGSKAGYGVYWGDNHLRNVSEPLQGDQTNQRAELTAAIAAMEIAISDDITHLEIRTDSKYTIQSATEWIKGWKKSNWIKKSDSKPVMNKDLMVRIDELQEKLNVKWTYVPGHSSDKGNDAADLLAKEGARKK